MLSDVTFILFCEDIENITMDDSYEQTNVIKLMFNLFLRHVIHLRCFTRMELQAAPEFQALEYLISANEINLKNSIYSSGAAII
jgi:hypothetical protein